MKTCSCKEFTQELWAILIDEVTLRHGENEVTLQEVHSRLSADDLAITRLLARLEGKPMRDIISVAAAYCSLPTAKEEFDRVFEEEIVPLETLLATVTP